MDARADVQAFLSGRSKAVNMEFPASVMAGDLFRPV